MFNIDIDIDAGGSNVERCALISPNPNFVGIFIAIALLPIGAKVFRII
jgi:hypothetical protein